MATLPEPEELLGGVPDSEEEAVCRYCLQTEDVEPGGQLIQPCACAAAVHQRCLARWVFQSYQSGRANAQQCEVCQQEWTGLLTVPLEMVTEQLANLRDSGPADAARRATEVERLFRLLEAQLARVTVQLGLLEGAKHAAEQRSAAAKREQEKAEADRDRHAARATVLARSKAALEAELAEQRLQVQVVRRWRRWWVQLLVVGLPCTVVGLSAGAAAGVVLGRAAARRRGQRQQQLGQHRLAGGALG